MNTKARRLIRLFIERAVVRSGAERWAFAHVNRRLADRAAHVGIMAGREERLKNGAGLICFNRKRPDVFQVRLRSEGSDDLMTLRDPAEALNGFLSDMAHRGTQ